MQNYPPIPPNSENNIKIASQQQKPDLLLLKGTLLVVTFLTIMAVIINFIPSLKSTEVVTDESPEPVKLPAPSPIIVNVPEQPQKPHANNDLGLTLEEYSNLSDPSDEVINCLKFEGGKGCFKDNYQPTQPQQYYQHPRYYSASNSVAVSVATGQVLPYWNPSSLPPIQGCPSREFVVKFGDRYYCGRRLIQP